MQLDIVHPKPSKVIAFNFFIGDGSMGGWDPCEGPIEVMCLASQHFIISVRNNEERSEK